MEVTESNFIQLNVANRDSELRAPPGFESKLQDFENQRSSEDKMKMIQNKAWTMAISPASSIFMNFILFYFVGTSLNIYSLVMIFTVISGQIKGLLGTRDKFREFEHYHLKELGFYKLIYSAINLALLGYSMYNFSKMGMLPFSPSDYVDVLPANPVNVDIVNFQ